MMKPELRSSVRRNICMAIASISLTPAIAFPQAVPLPKVVKIIVPFSAGAANDLFARVLAPRIGSKFNNSVVVDNRPGASGSIGAEAVARAAPDGATFLLTSVSYATNAAIQKKLPFDPNTAFVPIAMVARGPMLVVVGGKSRFKTLEQLLNESKGANTSVTYGSAGTGSIAHMSAELLNAMAGTSARHVPYKGVSNAVIDLLGGRIDFVVTTVASVSAQIQTGALRALAVTTPRRSTVTGDLVPVAAAVPGYTVEAWWGVFAPAKTPDAIVQALNAEILAAGQSPEVREIYEREGAEAGTMTSGEFAAFLRQELVKWRQLANTRKIDAE